MNDIAISVVDRVAKLVDNTVIVCNNSDYHITFYFDDEWDKYPIKTAVFSFGGRHVDVDFDGNECPVPRLSRTTSLLVGVTAGDITTTTSAYIPCKYSILCDAGTKISHYPTDSAYKKIMEILDSKQDTLYAGEGIYIDENNFIHATGGDPDRKLLEIVEELPELSMADEIIYYLIDSKSGYIINETGDAWIQVIYPPVDTENLATKDYVKDYVANAGGLVPGVTYVFNGGEI